MSRVRSGEQPARQVLRGVRGTALAASEDRATSPPSASSVPPVAERRLVSILFADLVGFTTLSEQRDAEDVRDLLSRYFDAARRIVERYGGTVEKFIGHAVMAVWGAPIAQEDDAERAVRAALDLIQAVAELGAKVQAPDLRARAGVLTGEAAVTMGARGQGMVAGDLVNTASRIQSVAEPGSVYVGDATRRSTEASIVYGEAGTHELKGKAEPLRLWRALRVIAGVGGALRSAGLEPPFVGRDRELRLVKDLYHASAEERSAHLVSVVGIAGIGKSRLSWEYFKYIDGLADLAWWHRGRCLAYGEGVTYWALAEMVRMRARIDEGEDQPAAAAKLRAAVLEFVADPDERRLIEPRLAQLLGLEEHAGSNRDDLFSAWRLFFERLADREPVVMVFEDMQWADRALLDFIEHLLEWSRRRPIFIMTLARPELAERHSDWIGGKRNFTSLYLDPLPEDAMRRLLSGLVPGLPEGLQRRILDRAEGVPLYAVETVRMLLDRGLLEPVGNEYRPTGPITALDVPETLHALIAARLDGLSPDERALVQDASVIGKTFTKDAVVAVSGRDPVEVDALLASLVRKEVLSFQTDRRSLERGQYGFLQDLLKLVAYETLSKRERKARLLAIAGHLLSVFGPDDEVVEVVASHYLEAYRAGPEAADGAEIKDRAREMLTRAGERAASLAAPEEARHYFEEALGLAADPLTEAALHERAGEVSWVAGQAAAATEHFERAIELFEAAGMTHAAARVSAAMSEVAFNQGRVEEAIERMSSALDVLATEEPDADMATLAAQLARYEWLDGRHQDASRHVELALTIAESLRLTEVISMGFNTKAMIMSSLMRPEESLLLLKHALQVALDSNLSAPALRAYNNLVSFLAQSERSEECLDLHDEAIELARKVGNRMWETQLVVSAITPLTELGRWDEALARAEQVMAEIDPRTRKFSLQELYPIVSIHVERGDMEAARSLYALLSENPIPGDFQSQIVRRVMLAVIRRGEGRHAEAFAVAGDLFAERDKSGLQYVRPAFVEAAMAAWQLRDLAAIGELLSVIDRTPVGHVTPGLRGQTLRFKGLLATAGGDDAAAHNRFKEAVGIFREVPLPFWLAIALTEQGEWLVARGRSAKAEPLMAEARAIFERLKAGPWMERVDRQRTRAGVAT